MGVEQLDPHDLEPMYRQLAGILRRMIESREIPPGRPIPSKKTLTQEYGVSTATVEAAVRILKDEGLLVTHPGRGLYTRSAA